MIQHSRATSRLLWRSEMTFIWFGLIVEVSGCKEASEDDGTRSGSAFGETDRSEASLEPAPVW